MYSNYISVLHLLMRTNETMMTPTTTTAITMIKGNKKYRESKKD